MLCFVTNGIHGSQNTDAAADGGNSQKCFFRYTPLILLGKQLVCCHNQEAGCIDYKEVEKKKFHRKTFLEGIVLKKYVWVVVSVLLLCGCAAQETFETISDEAVLPVMVQPRDITVELPGEAALPVIENDAGRIYLCEDYEIVLQTLESGDLEKTMQTVSGYSKEDLTVMETFSGDTSRYEFVWVSAGETGEQIGRGVVLDDGNYHYCLSVLQNAQKVNDSQINWNHVFRSFQLI